MSHCLNAVSQISVRTLRPGSPLDGPDYQIGPEFDSTAQKARNLNTYIIIPGLLKIFKLSKKNQVL